jgi:CheY-like chemotaxis protein
MSTINSWDVLVIEDEQDSMELVQGVLGYYGIQSVGVETAEAALDTLNTMLPTLVVVDLNLPGMDGWGFLKRAKADRRLVNVPFVAVTAYHTAEMAQQAIDAGFAAYFIKPIDSTSFVRELENIVNN